MFTRRYFLNRMTAGVAGINIFPSKTFRKDQNSFLNIIEAGARGDGITDDTEAIQEAIDYISEKGGGKIFFPYLPDGYKIAKPAKETVDGRLSWEAPEETNITAHPWSMLATVQGTLFAGKFRNGNLKVLKN